MPSKKLVGMMAIDDLLTPRTGAEGRRAPPDMSEYGLLYLVSDGAPCARGGATACRFSLPFPGKSGERTGRPRRRRWTADAAHRGQNWPVSSSRASQDRR